MIHNISNKINYILKLSLIYNFINAKSNLTLIDYILL